MRKTVNKGVDFLMTMPGFIKELERRDSKLYEIASSLAEEAMKPGALDAKTKLLIAMALDALVGADEGVKVLSKAARGQGATEEEIAEALRIAYYVAGNTVLSSADSAYQD